MNKTEQIEVAHNYPDLIIDLLDIFCGQHLGDGTSREVYVFNPDPYYAIKSVKEMGGVMSWNGRPTNW